MNQKTPNCNTTIHDIHLERKRVAEKFKGNISDILEDARTRQATSGRKVWVQTSTDQQTMTTPK